MAIKRTGFVCFYRPRRKRARVFTAKDVQRIAKYAQSDGAHPLEILAGVGFALGLGWVFCLAARSIDNALTIGSAIAKIGGILALGRIADFILTVLSGGLFKRLALTTRIGLLFVLAVVSLQGILHAGRQILGDMDFLKSASDTIHDVCHRVRELAEDAGEVIDDRYNDARDFTGDLFGDITATQVDKAFKLFNLP